MLRAHYNMPIKDFIAQLRTYVIAMGLSPMVVDCVDRLVDPDELEHKHAKELEELEDKTAKETKNEILRVVKDWLVIRQNIKEPQISSLLAAIESA